MGARKQSTPQYGARVPHRAKKDCMVAADAMVSIYLSREGER
jgi:hypothetical protein